MMPMPTKPARLLTQANADALAAHVVNQGLKLADRAVISDIECHAVRDTRWPEQRVWDTRPMLDEREHGPEELDMAFEAIEYARMRGLVATHAGQPHLLRILRNPA